MRRNSVLTGSGDFVGDQADGVVQRQAGLDRAHDDVERVRKLVEECLDPASATKRDEPAWQTERAGQQRARQDHQRRTGEIGKNRQRDSADAGIDVEALHGNLHARLTDLDLERRLLDDAVVGFLLVVEFLQRILDGLTPFGRFRHTIARCLDDGTIGLGGLDRFKPLADLLLVADPREQEGIGDRAGAEAGEHDECQYGAVNSKH